MNIAFHISRAFGGTPNAAGEDARAPQTTALQRFIPSIAF
jgi:hypothetical protein